MNIDKLTNLQIYNLKKVKCVFLDVTNFDYIIEVWDKFFNILDENVINFYLYTNNSSIDKLSILNKLNLNGIYCTNNNLITVSEITTDFLINKFQDKKINLLATNSLFSEFSLYDINLCEKNSDIVLVSDDTELTYDKIKTACNDVKNGALLIGTNKEAVSYYNDFAPACGSICSLIEKTTGTAAKFIGLPSKISFKYISEKTGYTEDEVCFLSNNNDFIACPDSNFFTINNKDTFSFNNIYDFALALESAKKSL